MTPDRNQLALEALGYLTAITEPSDRNDPVRDAAIDLIKATLTAQTVTDDDWVEQSGDIPDLLKAIEHRLQTTDDKLLYRVKNLLLFGSRAATAPKCDALVKALERVKRSSTGALLNGNMRVYYISNNTETMIDEALAAHKAQGGV